MECSTSDSREEHNNGSSRVFSSAWDWDEDQPFTQEDLEAIDAAFQSASKIPQRTHRRLPNSILSLQHPDSFSLSPCQAKSKMRFRYPVMKFWGPIRYSRTEVEVERASMEVLKILESKKSEVGQVAVGFDIEWRASFRKGIPPGKAAVMQICLDTSHCHVMHIFHSGIPTSLRLLLENSMLLKVGVGIGNDAFKLFKDYNVSVKAVEDLCYLGKQKLGRDLQKWSLGSLTENLISKQSSTISWNHVDHNKPVSMHLIHFISKVFRPKSSLFAQDAFYIHSHSLAIEGDVALKKDFEIMQLLKPKKIQLGNWETNVLSEDQLQYAATDAFASWYLYEVLRNLPDMENVKAGDESGKVKDASPQ